MHATRAAGSGKYLTLTLGPELYALDISAVREILDMTEITRIPRMPHYMLGVVNVRGSAVPVLDLKRKFGMEPIQPTLNTRIVILEIMHQGTVSCIGGMADSVREVLELPAEEIDQPPRMGAAVDAAFLTGMGRVGDRFVMLLDADRVFTGEELDAAVAAGESRQPETEAA
jgi:purine-binding chemotaxis protein CheW